MVDVSKDHLKVKLLWQREQTSIFGGEQNFTWRCHLPYPCILIGLVEYSPFLTRFFQHTRIWENHYREHVQRT